MNLRILSLDESAAEWDAALERLPSRLRDVYFTSAYHLLWQRHGDGEACGAVFEHSAGLVLYPFLRRRLEDVPWLGERFAGLVDIASAYGYGGPLVHPAGDAADELRTAFRKAFADWRGDAGVVSEFVRFHPLLHTEEGFGTLLGAKPANETVVCKVGIDPEMQLRAMTAATRRNVRKAQGAGLTFAVETSDAAYADFGHLYRETMERRRAAAFYLFDDRHFSDFRALLGDAQALLAVRHEGRMVAGALFMRSADFAHYHLGGSDADALELRPNNLLFFEAMNWAGAAGLTELHLGGGYRAGGQDELLRFKSGFSAGRSRLFLGRAIHREADNRDAEQARRAAGPLGDAGFFPTYRAPLPG